MSFTSVGARRVIASAAARFALVRSFARRSALVRRSGLCRPCECFQRQHAHHRVFEPRLRNCAVFHRLPHPGDVGGRIRRKKDHVAALAMISGIVWSYDAHAFSPPIGVASEMMRPLNPSSSRRSLWVSTLLTDAGRNASMPASGSIGAHVGREGDVCRHHRLDGRLDRRGVNPPERPAAIPPRTAARRW